ncbi:MAG: site-specific integrase [Burkholderiales bacterium]|nr:site-specific integrase [Burkholderiales bacterium]
MATIQARTWTDKEGRQNTRYRAQVRLRGYPPVSASFDRKTDAKAWATKVEAEMRDGRHFPMREAKRRTLADLIDRQLETVKSKRPRDYNRQKGHLGWWRVKLGNYTLAQVTPALIAEYRDKLQQENIGTEKAPAYRGPATANRFLYALSKAFSNAVKEWHWLQDNPVLRVNKETESTGRVRFLSDDERKALLAACKKSTLPELYLIVLMALTTGMRRGEILGLRWPDVDLERRLIVLQKTKNGERRSVPAVPEVAALLREYAKVRRLDTDLLFPAKPIRKKSPVIAEKAKDIGPLWFDAWWYEALKQAGIQDFRFHDLRHTAASYLAMSGATTPEIAAVLGHKTLSMVKRYAHLSDQHTGAVVERMTRKYFGA